MTPRKPSDEKLKAQGARIRAAIDESGKTQAEVCRAIGTGTNTMNRWLRGENSAKAQFASLAIVLGVNAEWIEHGEGPRSDDRADVIERFIKDEGPTLSPPLTPLEAAYLRAWPHHRVKAGRLRDAIYDARMGYTPEETRRSIEVTEQKRAEGHALGVAARRR